MSGVRRVWRWAPPYLAGAGVALPLAAIVAAWAHWMPLAVALAVAAVACSIATQRALYEWRRAALIERSVRAQPARRSGRSSIGWGAPAWRRPF